MKCPQCKRTDLHEHAPPASAPETRCVKCGSIGALCGCRCEKCGESYTCYEHSRHPAAATRCAPETSERCAAHGIHMHIGCGVAATPPAPAGELTTHESDFEQTVRAPGRPGPTAKATPATTPSQGAELTRLQLLTLTDEHMVPALAEAIAAHDAALRARADAAELRATYHEHLVEQTRAERDAGEEE